MDSLSIAAFFTPLLILAGVGILSYRYALARTKYKGWQALAQAHGWSFVPGNANHNAYIIGTYQAYALKIEVSKDPLTNLNTGTRIIVTPTPKTRPADNHEQVESLALAIIQQLAPGAFKIKGKIRSEAQGKQGQAVYYEQAGIEKSSAYLQSIIDLLVNLANAYPGMVALGGKTVTLLHPLLARRLYEPQPVIIQLLQDISRSTTGMFGRRVAEMLCPYCLARYTTHTIDPSWLEAEITYCGCRICSQSREVIRCKGKIIAVLNRQMEVGRQPHQDNLSINWLAGRKLFDFDEVHIIDATDEDVERFAVQIGNDTDPLRVSGYKQIRCLVSPGCAMSNNTMKILRHIFGQVEVAATANG